MEVFTEITTKVTSVKTISLTSKDILELMLSKGIISDEEYQHEAEVFIDDGMKQYKRHIDNLGGLKIKITTEKIYEETI